MALPFFYVEQISNNATSVMLTEDTSKHVVQVLRMKQGEQLQLTDGLGKFFTCEITDDNRKRCAVKIIETTEKEPSVKQVTIAISPVKNNTRFEWFLEKATEIGVTGIIPLICERTEKQVFKQERIKSILISAMLQSQQCWLPLLHTAVKFQQFVNRPLANTVKYIAHCEDEAGKVQLHHHLNTSSKTFPECRNKLMLIGPEGDFTTAEISSAAQNGFIAVALGNTRLRTETAGMVAATLLVQ